MELTAQELATMLQGTIVGDPNVKLWTLSKIEEGGPGSLSFLSNLKYKNHLYTTTAAAVLISKDFIPEQEVKTTLIKVADPYASLALLLQMAEKQITPQKSGIEEPHYISSSAQVGQLTYLGAFAYISEKAEIGDHCKIYPHVYIGDGVKIGKNVTLYSGVKIYYGCVIGDNCILHSGAVIGADGFGFAPTENGYQKVPQIGNVILEANVEIGANTCIDRATMGSTIIKQGTKLDNLIQIGHNVTIGTNTVIAALTGIAGSSKVGNNCVIAGQVGIVGHISVENNVTIASHTGVTNNLKTGTTVIGFPAIPSKEFGRINVIKRKLPELYQTILQLEKEIAEIKEKI